LAMNPRTVKFGSASWDSVTSISVDRGADKVIAEVSDLGPHVVFVDVPEQRVSVRVTADLLTDDLGPPKPGESGLLVFFTSPAGTDGGRKKISMTAEVTGVRHPSSPRGIARVIDLIAVSSDGVADPVTIVDAGGEL